MKPIYYFIMLSGLLLGACSPGGLVLDSTYDYYGNFTKYKTFMFLEDHYAEQNEEAEIIKRTVYRRLTALGYRYDPENPDLYIAYKYFDQPVRITGFHQTNLTSWIHKSQDIENKQELLKQSDCSQRKISLPAGSFVLNFMDVKASKVIWQGHFGQHMPWRHPQQLEASLMLVMDEYNISAYN